MTAALQWGGRFAGRPMPSCLPSARRSKRISCSRRSTCACSRAHVDGAARRRLIDAARAQALTARLQTVAGEIASGRIRGATRARAGPKTSTARSTRACASSRRRRRRAAACRAQPQRSSRDDAAPLRARPRASEPPRLRRDRARRSAIARKTNSSAGRARRDDAPAAGAADAARILARGRGRSVRARRASASPASRARRARICPLGSRGLRRLDACRSIARASATVLGFAAPSRNALDAVGDRDVALDLLHALRARPSSPRRASAKSWSSGATPAFGYVAPRRRGLDRLEPDAAEAQSRSVRARARARRRRLIGDYAGALGSLGGLALSYHRDLQETKRRDHRGRERGVGGAAPLSGAPCATSIRRRAPMRRGPATAITVATDIADALVARGVPARAARTRWSARR